MRYIKFFNESVKDDKLYEIINFEEYYHRSEVHGEDEVFNFEERNQIQKGIKYDNGTDFYDYSIRGGVNSPIEIEIVNNSGNGCNRFTEYIKKSPDEWFYVKEIHSLYSSKMKGWAQKGEVYFKCDTIEGLIQFIKDRREYLYSLSYIKKYESHSIRDEYTKSSPDEYYSTKHSEYKNPHSDRVYKCLDYVYNKIDIGYFLDLACGDGIVSEYLSNKGLNRFKGSDPYFSEIFKDKFNKECYNYRFEDISKNGLNEKFDTIICSYALHLCDKSYMNNLLYNLSNICEYFVVISPSKYPDISEDYFVLIDKNIIDRSHIRIYKKK